MKMIAGAVIILAGAFALAGGLVSMSINEQGPGFLGMLAGLALGIWGLVIVVKELRAGRANASSTPGEEQD